MKQTTVTITSALTSAFGTVATEVIDAVIAILPVALPVLGAFLTVGLGIKAFKKVTGRS